MIVKIDSLMDTAMDIVRSIHTISKDAQAFFVGGCVRDRLLGLPVKDIDIEVFGVTPQEVISKLTSMGIEYDKVGESFGVLKIHGCAIDITFPRKERKTGNGHADFEVDVDPWLSVEEAARRRDYTVNAIYFNPLTMQYLDPFNGRQDLDRRLLRAVDETTFVEDPLRALRGMQFCARFGMKASVLLGSLFSKMDFSGLTKERVWEEMKKALLLGCYWQHAFDFMRDTGIVGTFWGEMYEAYHVPQSWQYHPEGWEIYDVRGTNPHPPEKCISVPRVLCEGQDLPFPWLGGDHEDILYMFHPDRTEPRLSSRGEIISVRCEYCPAWLEHYYTETGGGREFLLSLVLPVVQLYLSRNISQSFAEGELTLDSSFLARWNDSVVIHSVRLDSNGDMDIRLSLPFIDVDARAQGPGFEFNDARVRVGTVWDHMMEVMCAFSRGLFKDDDERIILGLAAFLHDIAKPITARFNMVTQRWSNKGHDTNMETVQNHLDLLGVPAKYQETVKALVASHMQPSNFYKSNARDAAFRRLSRKVDLGLLIKLAYFDQGGRGVFLPPDRQELEWFQQRAQEVKVWTEPFVPLILGRHLIALGVKPSPYMGKLLKLIEEQQIEGKFSTLDEGLDVARQVIAANPE